jgi:ketosteroid isomerase-like protein
MTPLPEASPALRETFLDWLDRFAACVRDVDYAAARPLFHDDIVIFGTHRDVVSGLLAWRDQQWNSVWPKTADFRFDLPAVRVLASDDETLVTLIAPWTSTGFARDGAAFDRPGRATMVFHRADGRWLCVHSHMSLNKGVPQDSYAERPVKAW